MCTLQTFNPPITLPTRSILAPLASQAQTPTQSTPPLHWYGAAPSLPMQYSRGGDGGLDGRKDCPEQQFWDDNGRLPTQQSWGSDSGWDGRQDWPQQQPWVNDGGWDGRGNRPQQRWWGKSEWGSQWRKDWNWGKSHWGPQRWSNDLSRQNNNTRGNSGASTRRCGSMSSFRIRSRTPINRERFKHAHCGHRLSA